MSDNIDEQPSQINQQTEEQAESKPATMAEIEKSQAQASICDETKKKPMNISFSIWPPTQRTRDAVIHRLIETLSTPSILSKRYGTFPHDEASETATLIEEQAFAAAGSSASGDDDGVEILQVYSKEISKRMLDVVKSRSAAVIDTPSTEAESKPLESSENASTEPSSASVENES
ncbi:RNA polymerase III-inhibiting protein maf1 [Datura stramonium]|uniref:RNA polymerase III-inhibiting protein maf1 n=1 Tax=Datura stramonium TaxID=4076 RepID=A0ABS8UUI4_DATST|nr:RNA polymerase III-inhibiting protein maf1 [Datura stramonium]